MNPWGLHNLLEPLENGVSVKNGLIAFTSRHILEGRNTNGQRLKKFSREFGELFFIEHLLAAVLRAD